MSFSNLEHSIAHGRPLRLYLFELGVSQRWAYSAADRDIVHNTVLYQAQPLSDDGVRLTGETSADTLRIVAPADIGVAQLWRPLPPSDEVLLTIFDTHYELGEAEAVWTGSISSVRWPHDDRCEIVCQSLSASMDRNGLTLGYQRGCPHSVYDEQCGVSRVLFRHPATVSAANGAAITHNATAGLFAGGFVEWQRNGRTETRGVDSESGQQLALLGGTSGLPVGTNVNLYPGCDGTSAMCVGRFNNMDNNGGFRHMPGKSPFDGDPAF